jgi:Putative addiction module component
MANKLEVLEAQAMKLDTESRARLARRLFLSLEPRPDAELERLWVEEAERRAAELQDGRATARPAAAVLRRVRREVSRTRSRSTR